MRLTKHAALELAQLARACTLDANEVQAIIAIAKRNASYGDLNDDKPPVRARDIKYGIEIVRRQWQKQEG